MVKNGGHSFGDSSGENCYDDLVTRSWIFLVAEMWWKYP